MRALNRLRVLRGRNEMLQTNRIIAGAHYEQFLIK